MCLHYSHCLYMYLSVMLLFDNQQKQICGLHVFKRAICFACQLIEMKHCFLVQLT